MKHKCCCVTGKNDDRSWVKVLAEDEGLAESAKGNQIMCRQTGGGNGLMSILTALCDFSSTAVTAEVAESIIKTELNSRKTYCQIADISQRAAKSTSKLTEIEGQQRRTGGRESVGLEAEM